MYLGVDYYPEQWPDEFLEQDLDNIVQLNCNVIRIGEFAWHKMERREGVFDFSYFDNVISQAKKRNLSVIFGTPTATMPAWAAKQYPEVLSADENGIKRSFGGRRLYCFNSKKYRELTTGIVTALAQHYKNETAIVAWQADNEFGHEGSDMCYCESCQKAFWQFLEQKYGDIETLNDTWGTAFWSQEYNTFDEIPLPRPTVTTHNPSLRMDYELFRSQSIETYGAMQVRLLKEILGADATVFHDFSGGIFSKHFDFSKVAQPFDLVAYNNYPVWGGQSKPVPPYQTACALDFMRGLKGKNFWITEQIMGAQGHDVIGYTPRPLQAKMWAYQAVAHGCESMLFFRYRAATKGAEQFCYGVLDSDNRKRRKFYEVQQLFSDLKQHEKTIEAPIQNCVALVYDYSSMASFRIQRQSMHIDYETEVHRLYAPFYNRNVSMDVIPSDKGFSGYQMLLVPIMTVMTEPFRQRLKEFVKTGGTVLFTYRMGIKDSFNNLTLGKDIPVGLEDLIGGVVDEFEALNDAQTVSLLGQEDFLGITGSASVFRDMLRPTTGVPLFSYQDCFYDKYAAVLKNHYGNGTVYYIGCGIDSSALQRIADSVIQDAALPCTPSPSGVEVVQRGERRFVLNHTDARQTWDALELQPYQGCIV